MPNHRSVAVLTLAVALFLPGLVCGQPPQPPGGQAAKPLPPVASQPPAQGQTPAQPPLPQVADVPARVPFADWLADLRKEAVAKGISQRTVDAALSVVEPLPVVIDRDRTQAERSMPVDRYLKRRLDRRTVRTARDMARFHADLLTRVSRRYGVPPGIVVAVWGLESNFGRFSGSRATVPALATLAYDNRRGPLFREELFDALRILDRGDIQLDRMKGSWAGAMGQPQFMPSTYLKFAQDFDGDGRTDIWHSQADAFASIANFLKQQGWQEGAGWGRAVKVPAAAAARVSESAPLRTEGCEATRQMTEPLPWSRWKALGVRTEGGQKAPAAATPASLVRAGTRSFLVFDNYKTLLQYNCAHAYALSVALLSDQVAGAARLGGKATAAKSAKAGKAHKAGKAKAGKAAKTKKPAAKRHAKRAKS